MELISSGTKFYLNGQSLYGLKSTPDMGGTRERREVTNLLDTARRYIGGLYKYDDLSSPYSSRLCLSAVVGIEVMLNSMIPSGFMLFIFVEI